MAVLGLSPENYEALSGLWSQARQEAADRLTGAVAPLIAPLYQGGEADAREDVVNLLGLVSPETPKEAITSGLMGLTPGYLALNRRSPKEISALREAMANEQRARGPIVPDIAAEVKRVAGEHWMDRKYSPYRREWPYESSEMIVKAHPERFGIRINPDPYDQILRGTWYHGMSPEARRKVIDKAIMEHPGLIQELNTTDPMRLALRTRFPISLHDAESISNKIGEPAGVSLSMLSPKSQEFTKGDPFIHRVMPLYGGPPTERTVNLMTPEGKTLLNDAYDAVANKFFTRRDQLRGFQPTDVAAAEAFDRVGGTSNPSIEHVLGELPERWQTRDFTGDFNLALSNELMSRDKRALLYNPHRWYEYEMLALNPEYALPLDYRMFQEYAHPVLKRQGSNITNTRTMTATPQVRQGLEKIAPIAAADRGRLGEIYSERPWTQRLSEENIRRLHELVDPAYKDLLTTLFREAGR